MTAPASPPRRRARRLPARRPVSALLLALGLALPACDAGPDLVLPFDSTTAEAAMPAVLEALKHGDPDTALREWDRLRSADALPDGAWHYRALALMDAGREDEAEQAWRTALEQQPGDGRAHTFLADWLLDRGRVDEARQHVQSARTYATDLPYLSLVSGRVNLAADDDERAARDFRDYIEQDPFGKQAAEAHHALAQIAARRGDPTAEAHERASQYLEQVHRYLDLASATLVDDPQNVNERFRIAAVFLDLFHACGDGRLPVTAVSARQRELLGRAEGALRAVLELHPDHARALFNLCFVRTMERRDDEAEALYRKAIAADPDHAAARLNLARLLIARDEADEGRALLQDVLRLTAAGGDAGDRARAHTALADLDELQGDLAGAVAHLEAILELFPESSDAVRTRRNTLKLALEAQAAEAAGG